jgi:hypothetical protein
MKDRQPPRLALALLERAVSDNPALAGDLIEEFERGRSRLWFWWQLLAVVATAPPREPDEIRPLRLVDLQPLDALERSRAMSLRFRPVNLTGSVVHGVGGLGLVALALLVTLVAPGAWTLLLLSVLAGVALGLVRVALRRRRDRQNVAPRAGTGTLPLNCR